MLVGGVLLLLLLEFDFIFFSRDVCFPCFAYFLSLSSSLLPRFLRVPWARGWLLTNSAGVLWCERILTMHISFRLSVLAIVMLQHI